MDCKEALEKLYLYLDHEMLSESERQQIEGHLQWCWRCQQIYQLENNIQNLIRLNGRNDEIPLSLFSKIRDVIAQF